MATTPKPEGFTVVCRLDKVLADEKHPALIADAAERAHAATRLAQRLLNFHLLRCLETDAPLPAFGHEHWARKAWYAVTRASRVDAKRQSDPALTATFETCMPDATPVDSTRLGDVVEFEVRRYAATAATNIYRHFAKRVQKHVRAVFQMEKAAFDALSREAKLARKTRLAKIAFDMCSPPSSALRSDAADHAYVTATRAEWRLDAFPWADKPLAYHQKANSTTNPKQCHAHLLLPAMWRMLRRRELEGAKGFALLPVRTALVPRHTQFGDRALRAILGVGGSEFRKAAKREAQAKKRKRSVVEASDDDDDELGLPPLAANASPMPPPAASSSSTASSETTINRRPKAVVAAEKRADLARLFDLEAAGVHACRGKAFDCTFTSDGYAAHLQFSRPKPPALAGGAFPRKGLWSVEELRGRLPPASRAAVVDDPSIDEIKAPKAKLGRLCKCCVAEETLGLPFHELICVGCDPGKNEPVCMADPLHPERKLRMTASGRRHATQPAVWKRTNRTRKQSYRAGGVDRLAHDAQMEMNAIAYRKAYVDKPASVAALETTLGEAGCVTTSYLAIFSSYVDALKRAEPTLVPHYQQVYHRKLRMKGHVERQRFEGEFVRDVRATFDPERTGKTVVLFWGSWGMVAGRPGTPGNRGLPPTIGVGLARRLAKEDGLVVAFTPEHHTTATHHLCGGKCVADAKAAERRRVDTCFRRHTKEVRGLKVCEGCRHHVNRDHNAALNIGTNGLLLLAGRAPIRKHEAAEAALLAIENDMHGAESGL